jgi:hypothetical protein
MGHPPPGWLGIVPTIRAEAHFNGRVVRCFAQRPINAHALLDANPGWVLLSVAEVDALEEFWLEQK